ncbi:MAG TPA: elongation factor P [bacterium]|nr:elongation factor P [bacterium]
MLGLTDLKNGVKFMLDGQPHEVLSYQHSKQARGGAVLRTKLKNLISGAIIDKTFRGDERFEEAEVPRAKAQYLYKDGNIFYFMDSETYEQFEIPQEMIGEKIDFIKEGMQVELMKYEERAIGIDLPIKVEYEVTETPPGVKGDTAQGGSKPAVIETGATINVPLFINQGEKIMVDTRDGKYLGRA